MGLQTLRVLWRTFRNYRAYIAVLVVLGFVSAILEGVGINAAIPLLSLLLGVQTTPTDTISKFIEGFFALLYVPFSFRYLIIFILLLFVARAVATTAFGYIRGYINADFFAAESRVMMGGVLRARWPYLVGQKMGHLQNVVIRDVQQTSSLLDVTTQFIQSFSGFLMYLLVAFNISSITTLAVLGSGAVLLLVVRPFLGRIQRAGGEQADTEKLINKFLSEQIIGMKTLKAAGAEQAAMHYGGTLVDALRRVQVRIALIKSLATSLFQPFTIIFIAVVFAVSYRSPGFSAVGFIATLYLIQKMFTYLESGQSSLHMVSVLVPYARSVAEHNRIFAAQREAAREGGKPFSFTKELAFKDVSLEYNLGEPAVHHIDLTIKRGEMLALIGPSGAGKTTIADLLLRLLEPTTGRLIVDGIPAQDISLENWRMRMGYVSQDVFLFNGTIEDNIRFYRDELSGEDIESAAKQASIYEFVMSLPNGFKTTVGDRGMTLSGGQRQRIALARALADNPDILVLDEATSSLDRESERAIQEAIRGLHGNVAVFVIAHRLSTVEHADTIAVIEHGKVAELGTPSELRTNPNSYFAVHSEK